MKVNDKSKRAVAPEPDKLTEESRFQFDCHQGLECFTRCCHGIQIMLPPYDILRLKKALNLTSEEFLSR